MGMNNSFDNYFNNNILHSEDTSIDTEYIKKENDETSTQKEYDNINLQVNNCNNNGKTNVLQHSDGNEKVTNAMNNFLISIRKMEDLCKTPTKNKSINESICRNSIKKENAYSPSNFSPSMLSVNSEDWNSKTIKELQEMITPIKKKKSYIEEPSTFAKRKRRKVNDIGEYEHLTNSVKIELCDNPLNDMEHIEMLHDLDSVMDFKGEKISVFLSSTTNGDDKQDEETIDILKDPQIDPLSIEKDDIHNTVNSIKTENQNIDVACKPHVINEKDNLNDTDSYVEVTDMNLSDEEFDETSIPSDTENEKLSEDTRKRLYDMKVQLTHEVPPQHKVQSNVSKILSKTAKGLFLEHASLKKGLFSIQEDEILKNNWKKFCEVHNWNPEIIKPFLFMGNANRRYMKNPAERVKFFQYLANGLPCRSLNSVLQRCRSLFIKHAKRGQRYCRAEDEIILSSIKNQNLNRQELSNHFSKLAKVLNRNSHSIGVRYRALKKKQSRKLNKSIFKVKWTLQLVSKLIQNLIDITLCEKIEELKDAAIPKVIWMKLEKRLNIHWNTLKAFWTCQLHIQLFCPEPIYLNDIKIKLIEYVYGKGISSSREIIWPNVVRYFDGFTTFFLSRLFYDLVSEATKNIHTTYFPDIIEHLYDIKKSKIQSSTVDRFLPRLSYNDKNVQIIDENTDDTT